MKQENYRPAHIEFDVTVDNSPIPENLGVFVNADDALLFMQKKLFSTNQSITVNRFMDNFEKSELRKKVNTIMEDKLPSLEQELRQASQEFLEAKTKKEGSLETLSVFTNEAKALSIEIKNGLSPMRLDEAFTWKLPYKGRFYFFTYIDKSIRLVKIQDMYEAEKTELFSQGKLNEDFFDPTPDDFIQSKSVNVFVDPTIQTSI